MDPIKAAIDRHVSDATVAQRLAADIAAVMQSSSPVASEGWLATSWRPILMLTFGGLIVCRWLGWTAPGISEAEAIKLWSIMEFALGAFVVGRSAEKIAPAIADAVTRR